MYDVIVVGAGPVGLYTAKLLEERLKILVVEEKNQIGTKACSGLYSTKIEKFVEIKKEWVEHKVKGAVLHSPSGKSVKMEKKETAAYVVDREKFNKYLAKRVKSKILLGIKVKSVEIDEDKVRVITSKGTFESGIIIGCDGANSAVRNSFGLKPKEIVNGLIAIEHKNDYSDHVDLWFDKSLIPDGFFWKIPRGHTIEYGSFGNNVTFRQLENFFRIKDYEKKAAFIPIGPCKSYFNRCLLIGDAAGITKPWSGGGLIFGLHCTQIARDVIFNAFERNDFSEKFLKEYEKLWKKKIGKSIRVGMMVRAVYKKIDNNMLEFLFSQASRMDLSKQDMDFPILPVKLKVLAKFFG